ncbi:MAG: hypothetical protein AB1772_11710 [Candidatus Zixiibacteriota bacterium]
MIKKMLMAAAFIATTFAVVLAKDTPKGTPGESPMAAMKAEMMKCYVCKNIAAKMDEIGPRGMEPVKLNDGLAIRHWVKSDDPKRLAAFRAAGNACSKAGEECMSFTDERAKTELCEFCQGVRTAAKAGARMSMGQTPNGDMMVLTSADAPVQAQLATLHEKCALMASSMEMPGAKTSASKE